MATIKLRPDAETEWTEIVTLRGATGETGADGATITAAAFDGNDILFTLDDASTVRITNGKTAVTGAPGVDGDTPVRGTDYWTAEDIAAIEAHCEDYIDTEILGGTS